MDYLLRQTGDCESTPSTRDFIHADTESELRCLAWEVIRTAAMLLRLDIAVAARAMTFVHRLYTDRSFREVDVWDAALGALVLALKLGEVNRKIKDIIRVFVRLQLRFLDAPAQSIKPKTTSPDAAHEIGESKLAALTVAEQENAVRSTYSEMNIDATIEQIAQTERFILRSMGYVCAVSEPHRHIERLCVIALSCLDPLRKHNSILPDSSDIEYFPTENVDILDAFIQKAWSFVNDSFATTLCCRWRGASIACAATYLTVCASVHVSEDKTEEAAKCVPTAVEAMLEASGASAEDLSSISREMLQIQKRSTLPRYFTIDSMEKFKGKLRAMEKEKQNRLRATSNHIRLDERLKRLDSRSGVNAGTSSANKGSDALEMLAMAGILGPSSSSSTGLSSKSRRSKFR